MSTTLAAVPAASATRWRLLLRKADAEGVRILTHAHHGHADAYRVRSKERDYRVTVTESPAGRCTVACDCTAGQFNQPCKHVALVLEATGRWWAIDPQSALALVDERHGRFVWRRCPHCGGPLVWINRPRDWSHEPYASCPDCRWGRWERDHEGDILTRWPALQAVA